MQSGLNSDRSTLRKTGDNDFAWLNATFDFPSNETVENRAALEEALSVDPTLGFEAQYVVPGTHGHTAIDCTSTHPYFSAFPLLLP